MAGCSASSRSSTLRALFGLRGISPRPAPVPGPCRPAGSQKGDDLRALAPAWLAAAPPRAPVRCWQCSVQQPLPRAKGPLIPVHGHCGLAATAVHQLLQGTQSPVLYGLPQGWLAPPGVPAHLRGVRHVALVATSAPSCPFPTPLARPRNNKRTLRAYALAPACLAAAPPAAPAHPAWRASCHKQYRAVGASFSASPASLGLHCKLFLRHVLHTWLAWLEQ